MERYRDGLGPKRFKADQGISRRVAKRGMEGPPFLSTWFEVPSDLRGCGIPNSCSSGECDAP